MNDIEKIARITEEQVEGASVEALSNRPNDKTGFRRGGLSAQELKAYFSALAMLSVHKVNEIISAIGDEGAESDLLKLLYTALPEDADDEKRLSLSRWVAKVEGELKDVPAMLLRASETLSAFEGATATAVSLESDAAATVTLLRKEDEQGKACVRFCFGIPRGKQGIQGIQGTQGLQGIQGPRGAQGPAGKGFEIAKTYGSVAEMNGAFDTDGLCEGSFVLIANTVEENDNAKLFVKGSNEYVPLCDLSGAQGIQGESGPEGPQGPQGAQGPEGPEGVPGADYVLTDEDRQEIVQLVLAELGEQGGGDSGGDSDEPLSCEAFLDSAGVLTFTESGWDGYENSWHLYRADTDELVAEETAICFTEPMDLSEYMENGVSYYAQVLLLNSNGGSESATTDTITYGGEETGVKTYLFQNQTITNDFNYDLPTPTPGVKYYAVVGGTKIGSCVAGENGELYFYENGDPFLFCEYDGADDCTHWYCQTYNEGVFSVYYYAETPTYNVTLSASGMAIAGGANADEYEYYLYLADDPDNPELVAYYTAMGSECDFSVEMSQRPVLSRFFVECKPLKDGEYLPTVRSETVCYEERSV